MRIAVLSDVHANLEALDAVLASVDATGVDDTWVLGDIVGYGADPSEVVERLGDRGGRLLAGNHDLAAVDRFDPRWFNRVAEAAIRWTAGVMSAETLDLLRQLEPREGGDGAPLMLVHGSVVDPVAEYVTNERVAAASFDADGFELCFFGHTHQPAIFVNDGEAIEQRDLGDGETVSLTPEMRFMVNPGSVGQPRDRDPRAAWLLYDDEAATVTVHRVTYEIRRAQDKIRAAGLPDVLADRLAIGR